MAAGDAGQLTIADAGQPAADAGQQTPDSGPQGVLTLTPAAPTLRVENGLPATLQMQASVVSAAGATQVQAFWNLSRLDLATIDGQGVVTATGPQGGLVTITALYGGQTATAVLTVAIDQTVFVGVPATVASSFSATPTANPNASPALLYPADATIIPVNLQPMNYQWQPGAGNTLFRVALVGPFGRIVAYLQPAPAAGGGLQPSWIPDPAVWRSFAQNNIGQTITIAVEGTPGGPGAPVFGSSLQHLTLAASRFAGTIYYWTVSQGQVLQVSAGSNSATAFYAPPSAPPASGLTNTCMACHAVSPDGTKMAAALWGGGVQGDGTVIDLTKSPAAALLPTGIDTWYFSAFDPTGRLLLTSLSGALTLRDSTSGAPVPAGSGESNQLTLGCGSGGLCTQPAWSRDGALLAYAQGVPGQFTSDVGFSQTDLMISNWNAVTESFSAPSVAVAHDFDGQALANFYPSFSTDDALLAFTRSTCSYNCATNDQLLVVSPDGGKPVELLQAEGADLRNRYPNFSPFKEGGYHWMTFFSMRDYGFVTAGQSQRQIWVAAVDDHGAPTTDPSHPAFWLPGQDPTTMNDKAEWAPLPCVGSGIGCQGDLDCCGGLLCRETDGGNSQCVSAASACVYVGSSCTQSSDCCTPFTCQAGTCATIYQ